MEQGFELLEEKVRKAADLVKRLRKANHDLEEERSRLGARVREAEKRLDMLERQRGAASDDGRRREALAEEVASLRHERDEIRRRIAKLVEVLDGLE
jgi:predicted  nucleic acid-binding Zn-ribbon protein